MENEAIRITLTDEDGREAEFDIITKIDIKDKEYLIAVPLEPGKEEKDNEAIVLRIDDDDNGEEVFCTVEDDDEFQAVCEAYKSLFSDDKELN